MATIDQIQNLELERRGVLLAPHTNLQDGSATIGFNGNPNTILSADITLDGGKKLLWEITRGSHYVNYLGEEYIKTVMPASGAVSMTGCWVKILTGGSTDALTQDLYNAYTILAATNDNDPQPITINQDSLFGRIGAVLQSVAIDSDLTSTSSNHDTVPSAKAVVEFVNSTIAGALTFNGGYNALADTTDADPTKKLQIAPYPTITKGDTYVITVAGSFFGTTLNVGDMIIASVASPTTLAGWTLVQKNIPDIVDASETSKGIIELATISEVNTGTDGTKAVTPATLKQRLDTLVSNSVKKYSTLLANPTVSLTTFTILKTSHLLGDTTDIDIVVRDTITGVIVEVETLVNSDYSVTIKFTLPPANNRYKVTLIG